MNVAVVGGEFKVSNSEFSQTLEIGVAGSRSRIHTRPGDPRGKRGWVWVDMSLLVCHSSDAHGHFAVEPPLLPPHTQAGPVPVLLSVAFVPT